MNTRGLCDLKGISDGALETRLHELVATGRRVEALLVEHLREVEARHLHLLSGYESMFRYCQEHLGFSEYEAFSRINAARMAKHYPVIVELLERQELNLTTLYLVRDFVSVENHAEIFSEVARKSKRDVLLLMAQRSPRPDVPARLRKLSGVPGGGRAMLEPLSGQSYRLTMTVSAELKSKLERARDFMSHVPRGRELEIVIERAVELLLAKLEKRPTRQRPGGEARGSEGKASGGGAAGEGKATGEGKASGEGKANGQTGTSQPQATSEAETAREVAPRETGTPAVETRRAGTRRRHIPNALRRQIVERDAGQCTFLAADGRRCGCSAFLQVHHELPWARGGPDTSENLSLLCAAHNRLRAEQDYGVSHITSTVAKRRPPA